MLVGLLGDFCLVLDCDAFLADALNFVYCHLTLFMRLHCLFDVILLLLSLLSERIELLSRFLLVHHKLLVLRPNVRSLLDAVCAVIRVMLLIYSRGSTRSPTTSCIDSSII